MDKRLLLPLQLLLLNVIIIIIPQITSEFIEEADHDFDDDNRYHYEAGYVADWDTQNRDSQWQQMLTGRSQPPKCIDIPADLGLCRNMRYTRMRLPNLLDHDSIEEVIEQAKSWVPLLGIRCHPDTQVFLCSLFSPVCLEKKIWPCRSLCEAVKTGCEDRMMKYGFPWPEMLRCDKFPLENLCIGLQNDAKPDETVCEACSKPDTVEGIVDSYCSADFAIRLKLKEDVIVGNDMKLTAFDKKKRIYKKGSLKKRDTRGETDFYVPGGANCECTGIDTSQKKLSYLAMGKKVDNKLVVTHIQLFDQSDPDMKKALRAIRKQTNICQGGVHALAVRDQPKAERPRRRDQKRKSGRKDARRNRKRKPEDEESEKKDRKRVNDRNRNRDRQRNDARKLNIEDGALF